MSSSAFHKKKNMVHNAATGMFGICNHLHGSFATLAPSSCLLQLLFQLVQRLQHKHNNNEQQAKLWQQVTAKVTQFQEGKYMPVQATKAEDFLFRGMILILICLLQDHGAEYLEEVNHLLQLCLEMEPYASTSKPFTSQTKMSANLLPKTFQHRLLLAKGMDEHVKSFLNLMIQVAASHNTLMQLTNDDTSYVVRQSLFFTCMTRHVLRLANADDAKRDCLLFLENMKAKDTIRMWNQLEEGVLMYGHVAKLSIIETSRIFSVTLPVNLSLSKRKCKKPELKEFGRYYANIVQMEQDLGKVPVDMRIIAPFDVEYDKAKEEFPNLVGLSNKVKQFLGCCCIAPSIPSTDALTNTIIIQIHGGGFVSLSSRSHEVYLRNLSRDLGVAIFSIDYSLAPEKKYPYQHIQCYYAYQWIVTHAQDVLHLPVSNIILMGDSAGANLCLSIVERLIYENKYLGMPRKIPVVLNCPYPTTYRLSCASPSRLLSLFDPLLHYHHHRVVRACYDEQADPTDPFLSTFYCPKEILQHFPATYMNVGTMDPLFDECMSMATKIAACNGGKVKVDVFDELIHGFLNFIHTIPAANRAYQTMVSWLRNFS